MKLVGIWYCADAFASTSPMALIEKLSSLAVPLPPLPVKFLQLHFALRIGHGLGQGRERRVAASSAFCIDEWLFVAAP
jgi:hypothetical protein